MNPRRPQLDRLLDTERDVEAWRADNAAQVKTVRQQSYRSRPGFPIHLRTSWYGELLLQATPGQHEIGDHGRGEVRLTVAEPR